MRHIEDRNNTFTFNGAATTIKGGAGANPYNALSDFLLGDFYEGTNWLQVLQPYLTMKTWEMAYYVRDQWHVSPKLTVNYGVRWEYYPVPTRDAANNQPSTVAPTGLGSTGDGIYFLNMQNATVSVCGAGGIPTNCGISVSKKLFSPSLGIAYRPSEKFVIRTGYSLSPAQFNMGQPQIQAYPGEVQLDEVAANPCSYVGQLHTGLPTIVAAPKTGSVFPILKNTGNVTSVNRKKNFVRGYYQSYNFTVQRELPGDVLASVGYVGTHAVHLQTAVDINYGQLGGGTASQPMAFVPDFSTGITTPPPWGADKYNSLQATFDRRFSYRRPDAQVRLYVFEGHRHVYLDLDPAVHQSRLLPDVARSHSPSDSQCGLRIAVWQRQADDESRHWWRNFGRVEFEWYLQSLFRHSLHRHV